MTYKEIVDRFREVVRDHNQLQDFGYGNLSDIKTRSEGGTTTNTDYPYLFLNQGTHSRSQQAISYNFNMIVMDIAKDDDFLKIQSECQQYIDDVLARLRFHYTDQVDLNLNNITLTPFKERFQDTVAGMTASITIEIPQRLNECIAPFIPVADFNDVNTVTSDQNGSWLELPIEDAYCQFNTELGPWSGTQLTLPIDETLQVGTLLYDFQNQPATFATGNYIVNFDDPSGPTNPGINTNPAVLTLAEGVITQITLGSIIECPELGELRVDVYTTENQDFDPDESTPEDKAPLSCPNIVLNDGGWRTDSPYNFYRVQEAGTHKIIIEGQVKVASSNTGDVFPAPFVIKKLATGDPDIAPDVVTGWPDPSPLPSTETVFNFRLEWSELDLIVDNKLNVIPIPDAIPEEATITTLPDTNVKIYKL